MPTSRTPAGTKSGRRCRGNDFEPRMNANRRELSERGRTRITRIVANRFQFASIRGIRARAFFSFTLIRVHSRFPASFALACALTGFAANRADALDQDLRRFVAAKESQARELAKAQTNKVPS